MEAQKTSAQMRKEMAKWSAKDYLTPQQKAGFETLTDDAPDFIVKSVYDAISVSVSKAKDQKEKDKELKSKRKVVVEAFKEAEIARWNEMIEAQSEDGYEGSKVKTLAVKGKYFKAKVDEAEGDTSPTYTASETISNITKINSTLAPEIINLAIHDWYQKQSDYADKQIKPLVKKSGGGGGSKAAKDTNAEEIIHPDFTEEKATALWDTQKGYAFKVDKDEKCVWKEKKKIDKGKRNPLDTGKILEETIYIVKYRPVIRPISFMDTGDENRCQATTNWKPMRYNSKFARDNGFIGDAQSQCGNQATSGGMCIGCATAKKVFITDYVYKKIKKNASSFYTDENVVELTGGDDESDSE